jgi:hypothetical protein
VIDYDILYCDEHEENDRADDVVAANDELSKRLNDLTRG